MDRNQITGLILMLVLMTIYFQFFTEPVQPPVETEEVQAQEQPVGKSVSGIRTPVNVVESVMLDDSLQHMILSDRYGLFAGFAEGDEELITIENDDVKIKLSSKGGIVKEVLLKHHVTHEKEPLYLIADNSSQTNLIISSNYKPVNISELYYHVSGGRGSVSGERDSLQIVFRIAFDNNRYIEHKYSLAGSGYQLKYELNLVGMDGVVDNQDAVMNWMDDIRVVEKALPDSRQKTTINYFSVNEGFDYLSISNDTESEVLNQPIKWATFKQKFFTAGIIAENSFSSANIAMSANELDSVVLKSGSMALTIPIGDLKTGKGKFNYYFGPNNYQITKKVAEGFGENVDLGWKMFRAINKFLIIPIFNFLDKYIASYGVIIFLLVIIIRIILAPLTYKSHMSMAKMKVLKPEMDVIKEKHGGDMQKSQSETMDLYRKAGINPLSGCIPMLLQMPILLAMFNFFPNSIELRQKAFLWANDLSTYDSIWDLPFTIPWYGDHVSLFTLLMTASTILYTWSNSQMNAQMQGPMKTMQYMMPVMFLFFLNSFSSGLTYYYFLTNMVSFAQIAMFKKFIDEDKIHKMMEENRRKNANKKKSKFQLKLEDAMKAGEEQRKKKKKN